MPQTPPDLSQYAPDAATALGEAAGLVKFAEENPQYRDFLLARLSPDHRVLLEEFHAQAK